jgi:uncharacterized metal-binding protein YceD (DUF177 family)
MKQILIYRKDILRGIVRLGNRLTDAGHGPTLARVFSRVSQVFGASVTPTHEFSRRLKIDPWPDDAITVEVHADPAERQALAERFGLLAVRSLCGRGRLERGSEPGELVLHGWLDADVVQACVISLEPVPARLQQRVERRYWPTEAGDPGRHHLQPYGMEELLDEEEVEPAIRGAIDLGEAFAEELGLALDPYPRAAGAALDADALTHHVSVGSEHGTGTAFAALRQLQKKHAR